MGIQYVPGATHQEIIRIFRLAASRHVPVFTHVRSADSLMLPGSDERLTRARFDELHASPKSTPVVIFLNRQEVVDSVIADPAQRLEKASVTARRKGRIQEEADADIVVFDPTTVTDRATYEHPTERSTGMRFVVVNGVLVIDRRT